MNKPSKQNKKTAKPKRDPFDSFKVGSKWFGPTPYGNTIEIIEWSVIHVSPSAGLAVMLSDCGQYCEGEHDPMWKYARTKDAAVRKMIKRTDKEISYHNGCIQRKIKTRDLYAAQLSKNVDDTKKSPRTKGTKSPVNAVR